MPDIAPSTFGPEEFVEQTGVSRETMEHLQAYADLLGEWNAKHNLVSDNSLANVWERHFWDCAQIAPFIPPTARNLIDLGSGAGFPGLVLAEMLRHEISVTLVEATAKKCDFLRAVSGKLKLPIQIRNERIEDIPSSVYDVITSRACAPLPKLLGYAERFAGPDSVCLFLKGQNVGSELTEAHKSWNMRARQIPSLSDPSGSILVVRELVSHDADPS